MKKLRNWDNKTWLSSKKYISSFNSFLNTKIKFNKNTFILDLGCGRANIISSLQRKYKFLNKPIGIDILKNKHIKKNVLFKKCDAIKYLKKNRNRFDLILIKQTIHFLKLSDIKKLLVYCRKRLNPKGKIIIFTLETNKNEIPTFSTMRKLLNKSLNRDKKIIKFISNLYSKKIIKKFSFRVKITKKKYIQMIKSKYISTLLNFNFEEISKGVDEINRKYKDKLAFRDKLICLILKI